MNISKQQIFSIQSNQEFEELALEIFKHQIKKNRVYNSFVDYLGCNPQNISTLKQIPFLPVEFFKSKKVISESDVTKYIEFTSSGTTGQITSTHYVSDISIYVESFISAFEIFYGSINDYVIIGLLPSYLERKGSSLVYMVDKLIRESNNGNSGFYLNNYDELKEKLQELKLAKQKTLLLGVTYALLDLAELDIELDDNFIVMETGGMKGKRKEMLKYELHSHLKSKLGVKQIHSEYGMTELLSQAYSKGDGVFVCPPWMKILIREINDPLNILPNSKNGGINVIDLANLHSCSFIATKDLGKLSNDGSFEIMGRFDNSDIRGCNLLID